MKQNSSVRHTRGFTLIEALVAALVLALGMIAIGKLNGFMMGNSGYSKARSAAIALAEAKIEEIRTLAVNNYPVATEKGNDAPVITGVATFARNWNSNLTSGIDERARVTVTVTWVDITGTTQTIQLVTDLTPAETAAYASLADESLRNRKPRITSPTGGAKVGTGSYGPDGIPDNTTNQEDGTLVHTTDDGRKQLIDSTSGNILLEIADGRAFSKIVGNVYIADGVLPDNIYVMPSDAGACLKQYSNESPVSTWADGPAGGKYFGYVCYVGPGWYGNIGILRLDNANINERVCLGDPAVTTPADPVASTSRHPVLSISRMYRGYLSTDEYFSGSSGIGISFIEDGEGKITEDYQPATFENQHFMLATITGGVSDAACRTRMAGTGSTFTGNAGRFVCLNDNCPDTLPTGAPPVTIVSGDITASADLIIESVFLTGATCNLGTRTANGVMRFTCELDWRGWTGETWDGYLEFRGNKPFVLKPDRNKKAPPAGVTVTCDATSTANRVLFDAVSPTTELLEGVNVLASTIGGC